MKLPEDDFAEITQKPTFVDYEELGLHQMDESSNPLNILVALEEQDNWNFQPIDMTNAVAVSF